MAAVPPASGSADRARVARRPISGHLSRHWLLSGCHSSSSPSARPARRSSRRPCRRPSTGRRAASRTRLADFIEPHPGNPGRSRRGALVRPASAPTATRSSASRSPRACPARPDPQGQPPRHQAGPLSKTIVVMAHRDDEGPSRAQTATGRAPRRCRACPRLYPLGGTARSQPYSLLFLSTDAASTAASAARFAARPEGRRRSRAQPRHDSGRQRPIAGDTALTDARPRDGSGRLAAETGAGRGA